ncbi:hypothetical protein ACTG9Q_31315 [Actinokineospora sp. 24-640]
MARSAAHQVGRAGTVRADIVESLHGGEFAEVLARLAPDVVFLAVSEQPWHALDALPPVLRSPVQELGFGPWLPVHLAPVTQAMIGVRSPSTLRTTIWRSCATTRS